MALNQECHNCGHVQLVGIIENGRSGFPDPHAKCDSCKRKGTFYYPSPSAEADLDRGIEALLEFYRRG